MEAPEIKMEAPEFFQPGFCSQQFAPPERRHSLDGKAAGCGGGGGDPFTVDDLLDFSTTDDALGGGGCGGGGGCSGGDGAFDNVTGSSTDSNVTAVDSCNSSFSGYDPNFADGIGGCCRGFADGHFSSDLCVPYDDLAELEWLSNFAEESFSSEDLQKLQLISGMKARPEAAYGTTRELQPEPDRGGAPAVFRPDVSVPGKARSKRSRAAPGSWASRLLVLSQAGPSPEDEAAAATAGSGVGGFPGAPRPVAGKKTVRAAPKKKQPQQGGPDGPDRAGGEARKCLHCQTDKTPQWRTGPMGPKTLCNACGVRYKSGRLVPEYRPAASPTFMLTRHSNSHRKVLELRRQKELQRAQQLHQQQQQQQFLQNHHHQSMVFDVSNGEDYLIHQHVGPDFRQLM